MCSLENPHIPEEERLAREDDDLVHFNNEENAFEVVSLKLGEVLEWLTQRYKSKFKSSTKKESTEAKEERKKKTAQDVSARKRKAEEEARDDLKGIVDKMPDANASLQDRRSWELKLMQGSGLDISYRLG